MATDYIPDNDGAFDKWMQHFVAYVQQNAGDLKVLPAQVTQLTTAYQAWEDGYGAATTAQRAASAANITKDSSKAALSGVVRPIVKTLQSDPDLTDQERTAMGITVPSDTRHAAAIPTTAPVFSVDITQRLQHSISFTDSATPTSKAKPDGVIGCEVWEQIGGAMPVSDATMKFLGLDTRSPYVSHFEALDAGKTAYYMGRWVNTRGEKGPWGSVIAATIAA